MNEKIKLKFKYVVIIISIKSNKSLIKKLYILCLIRDNRVYNLYSLSPLRCF